MSNLTDTLVLKHEEALNIIERLNNGEELSARELGMLSRHIDTGCKDCATKLAEVYKKNK